MYATRRIAGGLRAVWEGRALPELRAYRPVPKPPQSGSRAAWDEYARAIGLDPILFTSKAALIDAINHGRARP